MRKLDIIDLLEDYQTEKRLLQLLIHTLTLFLLAQQVETLQSMISENHCFQNIVLKILIQVAWPISSFLLTTTVLQQEVKAIP